MSALNRMKFLEGQRIYRKQGNRYVAVDDPYACSGLTPGWWLVKVTDGCTSMRMTLRPDRAEIDAAFKDAVEIVQRIIGDALMARPSKTPLTEEQAADWNALAAKHGDCFRMLEYKSIQEIAEQVVEQVTKRTND